MGIGYGNFPRSGPATRTTTTPMNPHHVTEHNAINAALNEAKAAHNSLVNKYVPWFVASGDNVFGPPMGNIAYTDGKYDSILASGTIRVLDTSSAVVGDTGTWTPIASAFGGGGHSVWNVETRGTWMCVGVGDDAAASRTFQVNMEIRVTAPWTNDGGSPQFSFPTTWRQFTYENILPGVILNKAPASFGFHYPVIGVIHTVVSGSGGNVAGESNPGGIPLVRFLSQHSII